MKCLIVDDEALARSRLKSILGEVDSSINVIESSNGEDALAKCKDYEPELVFLDIRMPGVSGMEVAEQLAEFNKPPSVIFTTAYNEFALDAFDANATDYLLKPVRRERLSQALSKLNPASAGDGGKASNDEARQHIALTERGKIKLVPIDKIVYFRADNKYVKLRTTKREYVISEVLNSLEEELSDQFIRVHRNSLVAKSHINRLEKDDAQGKWYVFFKTIEDSIEVSRRQTTSVRKWLRNES